MPVAVKAWLLKTGTLGFAGFTVMVVIGFVITSTAGTYVML